METGVCTTNETRVVQKPETTEASSVGLVSMFSARGMKFQTNKKTGGQRVAVLATGEFILNSKFASRILRTGH